MPDDRNTIDFHSNAIYRLGALHSAIQGGKLDFIQTTDRGDGNLVPIDSETDFERFSDNHYTPKRTVEQEQVDSQEFKLELIFQRG